MNLASRVNHIEQRAEEIGLTLPPSAREQLRDALRTLRLEDRIECAWDDLQTLSAHLAMLERVLPTEAACWESIRADIADQMRVTVEWFMSVHTAVSTELVPLPRVDARTARCIWTILDILIIRVELGYDHRSSD